ncbi:RidA family protein [Mycobacterium sp. 236(2023)]|uniref:RidA family protein n=1 Tax=Mycobacterium sp. 236(2023) TaxID=3038163 RepID=UPI00241557E3|nr:RidA family protein [Mycobacterium sp. 236(2023)]MDG4665509.1 RidA family protein [Mycobacterium sp. 236(2023)]
MTVRHLNHDQLPSVPILSHAVVVEGAGLVYLSGQIAWDTEGQLVGAGDYAAQAAKISHNIDIALAAAETHRRHVVRETIYIVDCTPESVEAVAGALRGDATWPPPAQTIVGVAALAIPGFLVEVDIIASRH